MASRCEAQSATGDPCKNKAKDGNRCYRHKTEKDGITYCKGTTLKGDRCKNEAKKSHEKCYLHLKEKKQSDPDKLTCSGTTSKNGKCLKKVKNKGDLCHFHSEKSSEVVTETNFKKLMKLLAQSTMYDLDDDITLFSQFDSLVKYVEKMIENDKYDEEGCE